MKNIFYNAHHCPVGAFASFTLGYKGQKGGFGLELGKPADQEIYIGLESADGQSFETLPFYEGIEDEAARYDMDGGRKRRAMNLVNFPDEKISRDFQLGTDTWTAGDLSFTIYSPVCSVPDPENRNKDGEGEDSDNLESIHVSDFDSAMKQAIVPAVYAELTVDNTRGNAVKKAFFGFSGSDPVGAFRHFDDVSDGAYTGIGEGRHTAVVTDCEGVVSACDFTMEKLLTETLAENYTFGLGRVSALVMEVPAGEIKTYRFACCFYRDGYVTTALDTKYYYTKYFKNIEEVCVYSLENMDMLIEQYRGANSLLDKSDLSEDQKFMMIHAIRSYYGSTEFLENGGEAFWVVNEGEYRMMNTFDLTVDQLFFEMKMNPWTVRNELDMFTDRYSYEDKVRFPGDDTQYPGGISFTHDMGVCNTLSRPGYSSYERFGLESCFSHMTHEQLVNWVCCASVYVTQTEDQEWIDRNLRIFSSCLESMVNRDHPVRSKRNGIMSLDSSRVMGGSEITTYDSLDESLGQARNNLYLAVKSWASYVALERIFRENGLVNAAETAQTQAALCAQTIAGKMTEEGYIPAVFEKGNESKIIPAIEGLVFPLYTGCPEALNEGGKYSELIMVLKKHLDTVLVKGVCLFPDSGWKLSSTSNNSWLSKIYLCQFVARKILGMSWEDEGQKADSAHVDWLMHPEESYHCWSDQMMAGVAVGSKYYPRGVTSILWLDE